jgi:hypothetical protein
VSVPALPPRLKATPLFQVVILAALTRVMPAEFLPYMVGMSTSAQDARFIH